MTTSELIKLLKTEYVKDNFAFMVSCSPYIGGKQNKLIRQQILLELTGETISPSKCTFQLVCDTIKASAEQLTLFEL